jgi:hypothetical protein
MLNALANCQRCYKPFQDCYRRGLCATCFGEKVFGKKIETVAPPPKVPPVSRAGIKTPDHLLRCEQLADRARAHEGGVRRGIKSFW